MEIKAKLNKPYTDIQRMDFIVEQNHKNGYTIEETETGLQALGYTEEEIQEQERERLGNLTLTRADVERAIYQDKGMDFDDIVTFVEANASAVDIKALKIEFKANNFFRKHPFINQIGQSLGYTTTDLDYLFENKTLPPKEDNAGTVTDTTTSDEQSE